MCINGRSILKLNGLFNVYTITNDLFISFQQSYINKSTFRLITPHRTREYYSPRGDS